MFDAFKEFLRTLGIEEGAPPLAGDDPRVAAAALLHHVAEADGRASAVELVRLRRAIAEEFGLSDSEAGRVAEAGAEADAEAVDLYSFTSVLMRRFSPEERLRFVEFLRSVVFAEGEVHELEDNVVWRVCELLGVSTRERMEAKRAAAAAAARAAHPVEGA